MCLLLLSCSTWPPSCSCLSLLDSEQNYVEAAAGKGGKGGQGADQPGGEGEPGVPGDAPGLETKSEPADEQSKEG